MREADPQASVGSWWSAVAAIAATYVYFLIFAEFAFIELARTAAPTTPELRQLMTGLGAGGVVGAAGAVWWLRRIERRRLLAICFGGCAAAAGLAAAVGAKAGYAAAAAAVGLALGGLTVTLSTCLRAATAGRGLGLAIGLGTGAAYALCNVPAVFAASPRAQTLGAAVVALAAMVLPRGLRTETAPATASPDSEYTRAGTIRWVAVLLALVWMDSAAFYIIQHAPDLKSATWAGATALWGNAGMHLGAAVAAGWLLDRGGRGALAGAAVVALALACLTLGGHLPGTVPARWFYTAGVSFYSVVLVEYPARRARAGLAALVFAVAGWIGSALGIGMAQDLAQVPPAFVAIAVAAVAAALGWRGRVRPAAAGLAAALLFAGDSRGAEADPLVARGREVYIAEGCIHCHSQYVRPKVAADVVNWGPAPTFAAGTGGLPPLLGNRRQGPDLTNVGNRRSPEWNRLHLITPRAVSPGSRMPAYAHLFREGDGRGEALVAYLASLGAETQAERQTQIAAWRPAAREALAAPAAAALFRQLCAPCHGPDGRGDGPVAGRLSLRPGDWRTGPWRHVPAGAEPEPVLARIIKFGLTGLPMAGHEYLRDAEIVGLARHVRSLHNPAPGQAGTAR